MNLLNELIQYLNKDELRHIKLFLQRTNAEKERKDIALLDFIRKNLSTYDDDLAFKKLFKDSNRNNFYRLKNRLSTDICRGIILLNHSKSDYNSVLLYLFLTRFFLQRENLVLAGAFLRKAELKAQIIHAFELLDITYGFYIQIAQMKANFDPEPYIIKRRKNHEQIEKLRKIDDTLAVISYKLKISQNYSNKNDDLLKELQATIERHADSQETLNNPVFKLKIYQSISKTFLQNNQFDLLEIYLKNTLTEFESSALFNKNNHDTKLQMLIYLGNSLFKNGKLDEALECNSTLHNEMKKYNQLHYNRYLLYYYNAQVNILAETSPTEAISVLETAASDKIIQKDTTNYNFMITNLMILNFGEENFKAAKKALIQIQLNDNYHRLDPIYKYKLMICNLLIALETEDYDYGEKLLQQCDKALVGITDKIAIKREELTTEIARLLLNHASKDKWSDLANQMLKTADDNDLISYNKWIKKRLG